MKLLIHRQFGGTQVVRVMLRTNTVFKIKGTQKWLKKMNCSQH